MCRETQSEFFGCCGNKLLQVRAANGSQLQMSKINELQSRIKSLMCHTTCRSRPTSKCENMEVATLNENGLNPSGDSPLRKRGTADCEEQEPSTPEPVQKRQKTECREQELSTPRMPNETQKPHYAKTYCAFPSCDCTDLNHRGMRFRRLNLRLPKMNVKKPRTRDYERYGARLAQRRVNRGLLHYTNLTTDENIPDHKMICGLHGVVETKKVKLNVDVLDSDGNAIKTISTTSEVELPRTVGIKELQPTVRENRGVATQRNLLVRIEGLDQQRR